MCNKKVLLRERKRHTARRVVSTPSVVLTGYPPQAGYPPNQGTRLAGPGWTWQGTPLRGVCPMEFWVMLQSIMGYGYPPRGQTERQTRVKTLPSRRTTYRRR